MRHKLNSQPEILNRRTGLPVDCLVCNAAVYLPTAKEPRFSADGFEISVGTNHLGHFLLANLLLEDLKKRKQTSKTAPRLVIVGSITGNDNTVAGAPICFFCIPADFNHAAAPYLPAHRDPAGGLPVAAHGVGGFGWGGARRVLLLHLRSSGPSRWQRKEYARFL